MLQDGWPSSLNGAATQGRPTQPITDKGWWSDERQSFRFVYLRDGERIEVLHILSHPFFCAGVYNHHRRRTTLLSLSYGGKLLFLNHASKSPGGQPIRYVVMAGIASKLSFMPLARVLIHVPLIAVPRDLLNIEDWRGLHISVARKRTKGNRVRYHVGFEESRIATVPEVGEIEKIAREVVSRYSGLDV